MELIISAFLLGLYGSGHCVSMCGPVIGILGLNTQTKRTVAAFLYNLGRITTYSLLGIIAAVLSMLLDNLKPIQEIMRYIAAILMIFVALQFFGFPKFLAFIEKPLKNLTKPITHLSKNFFPITTKTRAYCAGLVWGLFPCGMVYAAFAISLSSTSFIEAPIIMFAFGLGTFAVMVSLSLFGNYAGKFLTHPKLRILSGILILVMTLFYIIPVVMTDLGFTESSHTHHMQQGLDHSNMDHSTNSNYSSHDSHNTHNTHEHRTTENHTEHKQAPMDHSSMSH